MQSPYLRPVDCLRRKISKLHVAKEQGDGDTILHGKPRFGFGLRIFIHEVFLVPITDKCID